MDIVEIDIGTFRLISDLIVIIRGLYIHRLIARNHFQSHGPHNTARVRAFSGISINHGIIELGIKVVQVIHEVSISP